MDQLDLFWGADHAARLEREINDGLMKIISSKASGASEAVVHALEAAVEAKIAQISQLPFAQLVRRPRRLN